MDRVRPLSDAVAEHVHAGDVLHLAVGHTRWSAAAREVVRQWWGRDPQLTLVMLSLSSLGALFFRGGLVRKVVTGYSGDTFPNFTPNPHFARAYQAGTGAVEHWTFRAFAQRLEAAARGLPAVTTRSSWIPISCSFLNPLIPARWIHSTVMSIGTAISVPSASVSA